jgi:aspartyl-tRNA(Asn)/glutamyl-tRNA(Gln) amidotransferase subunit A
VLYCLAPPGRPVSAAVAAAFQDSLARLEALGAQLEPFSGEGFDVEPIWRTINHTVWRSRFAPLIEKHGEQFSETFRRQIASAQQVSGVDYQQAMFDRSKLFLRVQALLARADFLAMPTLTRTALPIDQDLFGTIDIDGQSFSDVRGHWFPWTMPFNMTGHGAISIPCGFAPDGLPVGLQLVGRLRRDTELLHAAALFEAASGLTGRRPPL